MIKSALYSQLFIGYFLISFMMLLANRKWEWIYHQNFITHILISRGFIEKDNSDMEICWLALGPVLFLINILIIVIFSFVVFLFLCFMIPGWEFMVKSFEKFMSLFRKGAIGA